MSARFRNASSCAHAFHFFPYGWLLLAGIAVSHFTWTRLARRDERLVLIYVAALFSTFIGAKPVYVLAEGD